MLRRFLVASLFALLPFTAHGQEKPADIAPESATPGLAAPATAFGGPYPAPVKAKRFMVVAAHPLATEAGVGVLAKGGNAADALVAVQTVLGLVEPQSSGLGGGTFLLYYDVATKTLTALDGRETAPAKATPDLFLDAAGKPLEFFDAVVGGRSVGVPGTVKLLETAHKRWGKLPWETLFEPAVTLAEKGFAVTPRLAGLIGSDAAKLATYPGPRGYFFDAGGKPLPAGTTIKNPDYAATLKSLAVGGADAFYKGDIAKDIVQTVTGAAGNPGAMNLDDLANYAVVERDPLCMAYRGHQVCGMGPPSSGALAVGQILALLEPFDLAKLGPASPEARALIADATRLAFADRDRFVADPAFVEVPLAGLSDPAYLRARSELLKPGARLTAAEAGAPPAGKTELRLGDDRSIELPSTSHFVIVDAAGNVASVTTTIENGFGSRLMVRGFLLNNELTDFSFLAEAEEKPIANRVEPGKRPRSSMAPTIVLKDGRPVLAIGSPGGSRIIPFVANALVAILDWKMDVAAATAMPHVLNRDGPFELEEKTAATGLEAALKAMGYEVAVRGLNSGLHAVAITPDGLEGGADPRREGVAKGE